jgi:hypothetical protein
MAECFDRAKLVREKIEAAEAKAESGLQVIREVVLDILIHDKGYSEADLEQDRSFEIVLGAERIPVAVDYIICLEGKRLAAIKCSPGAIESRERHLIAFSRVADAAASIPLAVVTDGAKVRVLDTRTGKVVGEGFGAIPDRKSAGELLDPANFAPYAAEKIEKEKRILLAFDAIRCTRESCE